MKKTGNLQKNRREFVLFKRDETGPRWRGAFDEFMAAEQAAREFAGAESGEFFIFSFREYREVAKFPGLKPKAGESKSARN
jgi:hypothetical protein